MCIILHPSHCASLCRNGTSAFSFFFLNFSFSQSRRGVFYADG